MDAPLENHCHSHFWELHRLPVILEILASIKHLEIWNLTLSVKVGSTELVISVDFQIEVWHSYFFSESFSYVDCT